MIRVKKNLILSMVLFVLCCSQILAQDRFYRIRETNPNYRPGDWVSYSVARFVTSIAVGEQYVYFGTLHSGITRYDRFQNRWDYPFTTSNGLADNEVWTVAFDLNTGFLWCASRTAISYYHPTAGRWRNNFKDEFGLPFSDQIESIGITANKIIFETRAKRRFETSKFGGIILNSTDNFSSSGFDTNLLWFGKRAQKQIDLPHFFMAAGYLFNPGGYVEDPNFIRAEIVATAEDNWNNLWIATWGLGVGKGDVRALRLEMLDFGLANRSVNSLDFYENDLWLGGSGPADLNRGITVFDLDREAWRYYEQRNISNLLSDEIYSVTVEGDDVWFGTEYGLAQYSNKRGRWKTYNRFDGLSDNVIFDVVMDDSAIWVGTANGIDRIDKNGLGKKDSLEIRPISPGNLTLVKVNDLELMENLLWAATNQGVYVYDTRKQEGGFSAEIGGPPSRRINSISRYKNELWFGGVSGIDVFDVEKKEWLGVPEGRFFPNKVINRIVADKDAVWAATDQGVMKFNRQSRSWRTFTIEDGLISNHVDAILLDGDYIWFGTDRGVTHFYWNDPGRID